MVNTLRNTHICNTLIKPLKNYVMIKEFFLCLVCFYLSLSAIYTLTTLRQSVMFQLKHSVGTWNKVKSVSMTLFLSIVFGGISILSKVYVGLKRTYKNIIAWYALAKTAKKLTKALHENLPKQKDES